MPAKRCCFQRFAQPSLSPGLWALLLDIEQPADASPFELLALHDDELRALWLEHRAHVLGDFIAAWSGCRPAL